MTRPINHPRALAALLCATGIVSCDKNTVQQLPLAPIPAARILFFNFGVSAPAVNFYADQTKITAISSSSGTESPSGTAYGQAGNGAIYSAIMPGQYLLTGRIADTTSNVHNLPIDTLHATLGDGKAYSFYLSGVYDATAKQVDAFAVEDPIPAQQDYSVAYVRFVNAIYNANPMTLYAKNTDTTVTKDSIAVGGAVGYKAAGPFTAVPNGVYNLITRYTGSNRSVITRANLSFIRGHMYTIGARGDTTRTSGTFAPALDNTPNQ
ncbi:MAG TPA: hypothetical protein VM716_03260 [Gemmatimonadales bacterium]|nr:hypothetical protein [Gemmatimonadales bacterium]